MRTWVYGGAIAGALGCGFDAGGLGSGSTALGSASSSGDDAEGGAVDTSASTVDPSSASTTTDGGDTHASAADEASSTGPAAEGTDNGTGSTGPVGCVAEDWWDDAWSQRRTLDISGLGLTTALEDGVVMLRLDPERIDYAATEPGGHDLRFVQGGAVLPYEIERWNPRGVSWVWLRVPEVPAEADEALHVQLYHGNSGAIAADDGAATWAGFVSVHHLEDYRDATDNGHDAGSPAFPTPSEGLVAGAQLFDGDDDHLVIPGEASFDFTTALTVEALVRVEDFDVDWQAVVTKGDDSWRMARDLWSHAVGFGSDTQGANDNLVGDDVVDDNEWHHVAIVYDGTTKRVYVDGAQDAQRAYAGPLRETDDEVMIGANSGFSGREFHGRIDEVRISASARSADYFSWTARSLLDQVVQWGEPESCVP